MSWWLSNMPTRAVALCALDFTREVPTSGTVHANMASQATRFFIERSPFYSIHIVGPGCGRCRILDFNLTSLVTTKTEQWLLYRRGTMRRLLRLRPGTGRGGTVPIRPRFAL